MHPDICVYVFFALILSVEKSIESNIMEEPFYVARGRDAFTLVRHVRQDKYFPEHTLDALTVLTVFSL